MFWIFDIPVTSSSCEAGDLCFWCCEGRLRDKSELIPMVFKEFEGYVFSGSLFVDVIAWSSGIVVYPLYVLLYVWREVVFCVSYDLY